MKHLKPYNEELLSNLVKSIKSVRKDYTDSKEEKRKAAEEETRRKKAEEDIHEEAWLKQVERVKGFINNTDAIMDCFVDLTDISDSHKIEKGNSTVTINFNIKGIAVKDQRKSERNRQGSHSTSFSFDEAHLMITDQLADTIIALREAKSQLKTIEEDMEMDVIFKKDKIKVELSLGNLKSKYYQTDDTPHVFRYQTDDTGPR